MMISARANSVCGECRSAKRAKPLEEIAGGAQDHASTRR
jgi:hypothetical protein